MITIIDYGMGNLGSIINMFKKIGVPSHASSSAEEISRAEKIVLPGVGAFDSGMSNIKESGLREILDKKVLVEKIPILGVCLGMQLLTEESEEGDLPGLGWIKGKTIKFNQGEAHLKIPHMGWNYVDVTRSSPLYSEMPDDTRFYFVHSYHVVCEDVADVIATSNYGIEFCASLNHGNIWGAQFHPEKSHKFGLQLLKNFANL